MRVKCVTSEPTGILEFSRTATAFCRLFVSLLIFGSAFPEALILANDPRPVSAASEAELKQVIAELIVGLGSEHYATRRQAQDQLQEIGVPALDQLQEATLHPDPQIAHIARYLIRSSFHNWTNENDPVEVQKLLKNYGSGDARFREERIFRLSMVSESRGLPALLRIARFEVDGWLSRTAALTILKARLYVADRDGMRRNAFGNLQDIEDAEMVGSSTEASQPEQTSQRSSRAESMRSEWRLIEVSAAAGKNQACQWLEQMARAQLDPENFDSQFWMEQVDAEKQLLGKESQETSRDVYVAFGRMVSEQILQHGERDKALAVANRLLNIEYPQRDRLAKSVDFCEWSLARGFDELAVEQCERFDKQLIANRNAKLDYLRAEAYGYLSESDLSNRYATIAFQRASTDTIQAKPENEGGTQIAVPIDNRFEIAEYLKFRRQFAWSEREYRTILDSVENFDPQTVMVAERLASLLSDGQDYMGAVETLKPVLDQMDADPTFAKEIDEQFNFNWSTESSASSPDYSVALRARYLHLRAQDKIRRGELQSAKPDLREAWKLDRSNIDIAITMWKNRDDASWNAEAEKAVEEAIGDYRSIVPSQERIARAYGRQDSATTRYNYGQTLNTFAWLLVCTDNDLATAIEFSRQACSLIPDNAALLDTYARCHFRMGRVAEAIRIQRRALALEPYSRELQRSLEEFQAALKG